jgi:hypothetical protein
MDDATAGMNRLDCSNAVVLVCIWWNLKAMASLPLNKDCTTSYLRELGRFLASLLGSLKYSFTAMRGWGYRELP